MKRLLTTSGAVALTIFFAGSTRAGEPNDLTIEHASGSCIAPGVWPRVDARISPSGEAKAARVLFHASDSAHWYSVEMRETGQAWSATLPRPKDGVTRIGYFVVATGKSRSTRLPESSAFVVDVDPDCGNNSLPKGERGPEILGLVGNAPRDVPGFDIASVRGFVEGIMNETPSVESAEMSEGWLLPSKAKVRIRTLNANTAKGPVVGDDGRLVTVRTDEATEPVTLAKDGGWVEGRIQSVEPDSLVLSVGGKGRIRVRRTDLTEVQYYKRGSTAMGIVGAFAGMGGGLLATALVCVTADDLCDSAAPFWVGMALGGALGAAGGGSGDWEPVPVLTQRRVALAVKPVPRGAAVGVRISF